MTSNQGASALNYPCGEPPALGQLHEVANGVHWIAMPLTGPLARINLWLLEDEGGPTLIDAGLNSDESVATWNDLFAGPLAGKTLRRVIATHMHPDHMGLAGWLTRRFSCRLWMTQLEYLNCRVLIGDTGRRAPEEAVAFYRRAGWDRQAIENYRSRFGNYGKMTAPLPDSYRRIQDGEVLRIGGRDWEVVTGIGHTPEHACLYCASQQLFISGDQVLPRISSNVSVFPTEPDADPLDGWLVSLEKLRTRVPDDVLVLPAHNEPFHGLHARLDHLKASQFRALDRLRETLRTPQRVIDVFGALFSRPISLDNPMLLGLATGESIAHLNYLLHRNEAVMEIDAKGVAWYAGV